MQRRDRSECAVGVGAAQFDVLSCADAAGEEIPLGARIFALADTLDAMTSDRPYRPALGWSEAAGEIVAQSGRQFDPEIVRAFVALEDDLRAVYEDLSLVA